MPTQLPREATDFFGELLLPHMYSILESDADKPLTEDAFTPEVQAAVITSNGELTSRFKYISDLRASSKSRHKVSLGAGTSQEARHKCLILGAGFVSGPLVEYLTRDGSVQVTVG
jgi:alpha-aminoadipic semialdehyde synthase